MRVLLQCRAMRKFVLAIVAAVAAEMSAAAFGADDIRFMTFENGMRMYLIEDTSSALVRMEARVDAGYSAQTEKDAGYFQLYARLKGAEITADGVSVSATCAPGDAERTMKELSSVLEPLSLTDRKLRAEIGKERASLAEYAEDGAGFINAAIEARVFRSSPWKHESSADAAVFTRNSLSESRSVLDGIARDFYVPERTVLFVSGNITAASAETFARRSFGRFRNGERREETSPLEKKAAETKDDGARLFVLADDEFSSDMTQLVIQHAGIPQTECDMAAVTLEDPFTSLLKAELVADEKLGIRGGEYVNASSVQRRGSSRLVIQALLESVPGTTPPEQVAEMLRLCGRKDAYFSAEALEYQVRQYTSSFVTMCDSSSELMGTLADWDSLMKDGMPEQTLFRRLSSLESLAAEKLAETISSSKPFVFAIVGTKSLAKNRKAFEKMGFRVVTKKDGAWFRQDFYRKLAASLSKSKKSDANEMREEGGIGQPEEETFLSARRFVEQNTRDFRTFTLPNGIPVVVKKTGTNTACLSLTIFGGELMFAHDAPGLASVLADAIAVNMRNALDDLHYGGRTRGIYGVGARTEATHSVITVTFSAEDFAQTVSAVAEALIYGDIPPALADGVSYDERTQWRLKTGTSVFQMTCRAMGILYKGSDIPLLFDDRTDRPRKLSYTEIMENYPAMLDSSRYSIVIAGDFSVDETFARTIDSAFGALGTNAQTAWKGTRIGAPAAVEKAERMQLRHLFLTDVSADKAGPKPAVLIPTTKFLDPVLFIIPTPDMKSGERALFDAVLAEISSRMEAKAARSEPTTKVVSSGAEFDMPFARITALNAKSAGAIDKAYRESVEELKAELAKIVNDETEITKIMEETENGTEERTSVRIIDYEKNALLSKIENGWIVANLAESGTARGTAELVQKGALLGKPNMYLEQYEAVDEATAADYILVITKFIPGIPPVRIYSRDS